jgi:hypothetical protein
MIVLRGRTMLNLDTGLIIEWSIDERLQHTATVFLPGSLTPDGGRAGYTLDADFSRALWTLLSYPSGRESVGVIALGDGE